MMYYNNIDDPTDPMAAMEDAHDKTIIEMKEQLLKAVGERK